MAGEKVEDVISKHSKEIDEQMISLLDKRSKMASRYASSVQHALSLEHMGSCFPITS